MQAGKASVQFECPPLILSGGSIVGKKEGEGPLGPLFDRVEQDDKFGKANWEEAESRMQKEAVETAILKAGLQKKDIRYLLGGDSAGAVNCHILWCDGFGNPPVWIIWGLLYYGGSHESGSHADSSRICRLGGCSGIQPFCHCRKTVSFSAGVWKPAALCGDLDSNWLRSSDFAVRKSKDGRNLHEKLAKGKTGKGQAVITGVTTGKIVDLGIKDSMNMGAAMAPAAFSVINQNFQDFQTDETWYDKIITGDLGTVGRKILLDFMKEKGHDLEKVHMDCGIEIFDPGVQDTHAGGSGCGCSAVTFCSYILPRIREGVWKRVLFVPTGALLSTVSFNEGQSVPGIAHGVVIEHREI